MSLDDPTWTNQGIPPQPPSPSQSPPPTPPPSPTPSDRAALLRPCGGDRSGQSLSLLHSRRREPPLTRRWFRSASLSCLPIRASLMSLPRGDGPSTSSRSTLDSRSALLIERRCYTIRSSPRRSRLSLALNTGAYRAATLKSSWRIPRMQDGKMTGEYDTYRPHCFHAISSVGARMSDRTNEPPRGIVDRSLLDENGQLHPPDRG